MKKAFLLTGFSLFLFLASTVFGTAQAGEHNLTIIYSNNIIGKIQPCPS